MGGDGGACAEATRLSSVREGVTISSRSNERLTGVTWRGEGLGGVGGSVAEGGKRERGGSEDSGGGGKGVGGGGTEVMRKYSGTTEAEALGEEDLGWWGRGGGGGVKWVITGAR